MPVFTCVMNIKPNYFLNEIIEKRYERNRHILLDKYSGAFHPLFQRQQ